MWIDEWLKYRGNGKDNFSIQGFGLIARLYS
jgi:hypothetical protein